MTDDTETSTRQPVEDTIPGAAGEQPAADGGAAAAGPSAGAAGGPSGAAGGAHGALGGASAALASAQQRAAAIADERPEVAVGAAFAGGFLLAMILRRLAR